MELAKAPTLGKPARCRFPARPVGLTHGMRMGRAGPIPVMAAEAGPQSISGGTGLPIKHGWIITELSLGSEPPAVIWGTWAATRFMPRTLPSAPPVTRLPMAL